MAATHTPLIRRSFVPGRRLRPPAAPVRHPSTPTRARRLGRALFVGAGAWSVTPAVMDAVDPRHEVHGIQR